MVNIASKTLKSKTYGHNTTEGVAVKSYTVSDNKKVSGSHHRNILRSEILIYVICVLISFSMILCNLLSEILTRMYLGYLLSQIFEQERKCNFLSDILVRFFALLVYNLKKLL